ncbi:MAG: sensor histidine kinase [Roseobacter sp.]
MPHRIRISAQDIVNIDDDKERRQAAALLASELGVFEYEPQQDRAFWDDRVHELWGMPRDQTFTYAEIMATTHPDDRALVEQKYLDVLDPNGHRHFDHEYRILPRDGSPMRWIHAKADCKFIGNTPVRLVGTMQDVTKRRTAEARAIVLVDELEHRVKNTLASVISLAALSSRGHSDLDTFIDGFKDRLHSLAHAHDWLRVNDWQPLEMKRLLEEQVGNLFGGHTTPITTEGPDTLLEAHHVPTFSMALHELLTNALKYGALSDKGGEISFTTSTSDTQIEIEWREKLNSPLATPVTRKGFGRFLLTQILPSELSGKADLEYAVDGLRFTLTYPHKRT